ncbi:heme biosynthesis protein HemY [Pasteurella multocida]|uniref:heme biosynthesis protein HemY n=1 Tax=Pasteurella multocida TaxID=747 RepID=UPI002024C0CA|nr:heme biosynthesis protein HemY [Pasteurella multocida]MEB3467473.1 heme biosynthesis protein HemY [Pasteurella multocida]MEB3498697.1 heme biosynthesis protein HemY [Pasteurella multocida]URK01654.1 heme biosynthesis protein HemY [Pasteurella multocida]HDR1814828.1 heme biosynthesis protein HemY [Pasteurella multocida]HDR1859377.1 heme biosynthesis protein HemY [Pasteurella multocida]
MFRVLFLMLVLLAGLIAGPYLSGKQGYVLIETNSYNIEMSITMLVVFFVIAMAVIYGIEVIVTRFCRLSSDTYHWFSRRKRAKAQKQTLEGLMRMNEGDYSKAEKLIGKNAKHSEEPILNFITAAEAAQQRGDEFSANRYLLEATELAGSDNLMVELARTRILLQQGKLPAARSSVDSLLVMTNRNKEVLKLAVDIYLKSKAYLALDKILDQIESAGLYTAQDFIQLQRQVENGLLDEKMNEEGVDGLLTWWNDQPRKRRHDLSVKIALIQRLIDCNDHETAYELTLEALKKVEDQSPENRLLCTQIARLQPEDNSTLIKLMEKRANKAIEGEHCCIYRALGYLYVRNNDFTQASQAFKHVVANKAQLEATDVNMAAYVFEQVGENALAQQVREESLKETMAVSSLTHSQPEEPPVLLESK